jgi:hypothetical protein
MLARWKTVALLALLAPAPVLAIATPAASAPAVAQRAKPRKPNKKPPPAEPPAPAPAEPAADKASDPAPAAPAPGDGAPAGDLGNKPGEVDKPTAAIGGAGTAGASDAPDVDSLRQEYLSLRDELFKSRARANAVASQLYSTRIQIKLTYTTGRYYSPAKSSIRLDGASVYEDASGAIAGDDGIRFDGYVAPGRHLITFHVEATGKDDDSFTSSTESQIVVKAVAGKDLLVAAKAKDTGDIAYEWKRSEHGSYGLGIDVAVKTAKTVELAPVSAPTKADKK